MWCIHSVPFTTSSTAAQHTEWHAETGACLSWSQECQHGFGLFWPLLRLCTQLPHCDPSQRAEWHAAICHRLHLPHCDSQTQSDIKPLSSAAAHSMACRKRKLTNVAEPRLPRWPPAATCFSDNRRTLWRVPWYPIQSPELSEIGVS
jgi:hypothetical protein